MSFIDTINADIKQAMIEKRTDDLSTLRMLLSALKNKKIELGNKNELTDEEAQAVVKSEVKKRKDSIDSYKSGGREDLAEKEQSEIDLLKKYLPEQMSEEEIEKIVSEIVNSLDEKNMSQFGAVMGQAMQKTKGQADGQVVSAIVKKQLLK